jgi:hypothetical protein
MEYNTNRDKLTMPEYGRNIQRMVDYLRTIEDPEKRQKNAQSIIELMGVLNPHLRNVEDFRHKLWDHLYLIADFDLDIKSPYPTPTREKLDRKPEALPYPEANRKFRHLGKNLNGIIEKALKETDEDKKKGFTGTIAYYMKLAYTNWHNDLVHDDIIKNEHLEITNGELNYTDGDIKVRFIPKNPSSGHKKGGSRNGKNNNNNRNNKGRKYRKPGF